MLNRLWPAPMGMLATAATAVGFHDTPFWTAVFSACVGIVVSVIGFYIQWQWKKSEHQKDNLIRSMEVQVQQQQQIILDLHQMIGGHVGSEKGNGTGTTQ